MKLAFTLHKILTGKDRKSLAIGAVHSFEDDVYADLLKVGAVREPTESEIEIFESAGGKATEPKATEPKATEPKATEPKAPAKAFKSLKATETTIDPDEVEEI